MSILQIDKKEIKRGGKKESKKERKNNKYISKAP